MNRNSFELLGVLAVLGGAAVACKDTPVASNVGTPTKIVADYSFVSFTKVGASQTVTARVVDQTNTPLAQTISVTSCNSAIATAIPASVQPVPATALTTTITSVALDATCVIYTSAGVSPDTVVVLPGSYTGALSSTTPQGGSTLVIHSTSSLKFIPAKAKVTFTGVAEPGVIVGVSADSIAVLVPFGASGPVTIDSISVAFVPGLEITIPTLEDVTQTGNLWAAAVSWQTAPDISALLPAASGTTKMVVGLPASDNSAVCPEAVLGAGSAGPCAMFKFTVASPTPLTFTADWTGAATNPDVDIYACSDSTVANFAAACFEDGGAGATGVKPQSTGSFTYPAGTHYFVIENYAGTQSPNIFVTITHP